MIRIFHIFKSRFRRSTRCGAHSMTTHAMIPNAARDPWFWREGAVFHDVALCVRCARHVTNFEHPTPYAN